MEKFVRRAGARDTVIDSGLTMTSTFLLTLHLEWALMIFFTVARGYIFCPGAIVANPRRGQGAGRVGRVDKCDNESVLPNVVRYGYEALFTSDKDQLLETGRPTQSVEVLIGHFITRGEWITL
jgi:hypothetical protein